MSVTERLKSNSRARSRIIAVAAGLVLAAIGFPNGGFYYSNASDKYQSSNPHLVATVDIEQNSYDVFYEDSMFTWVSSEGHVYHSIPGSNSIWVGGKSYIIDYDTSSGSFSILDSPEVEGLAYGSPNWDGRADENDLKLIDDIVKPDVNSGGRIDENDLEVIGDIFDIVGPFEDGGSGGGPDVNLDGKIDANLLNIP